MRLEGLTVWPRRMTAPVAAAYMGIEESKFRRQVEKKVYPAGLPDGGNVLWDKKVLDAWIDAWSGTDGKKVRKLESF